MGVDIRATLNPAEGLGLPVAERWVLISVGVKEVLMAWQLAWVPAPTAELPSVVTSRASLSAFALTSEWLSTRPPPKGGFRRKSNPQVDIYPIRPPSLTQPLNST